MTYRGAAIADLAGFIVGYRIGVHLPFGKTRGGIEDLVQICELELAAFDFDDGGSGHGVVSAASYQLQNGSQYRCSHA
jgi:hypothetical protein